MNATLNRRKIAQMIGANDDLSNAQFANSFYYYLSFSTGAIAAGTSRSAIQRVPQGGALIVWAICGVLHDGSGGAIAASELVTVDYTQNDGAWGLGSCPWDCGVGTAVQPFYLGFQQPLSAGANIQVTVTNGAAVSVTPVLVMHGYTLKR